MATLTLRNTKGTPLTKEEVDQNFTNLNDEAATITPSDALPVGAYYTYPGGFEDLDGVVAETRYDEVETGTPTVANTGSTIAYSPDGSLLAVGHGSSPYLTVLNTSDWSVVPGTPVLASTGFGVDFSPDGTKLAIAYLGSPYLTVLNTSDWSVVPGTPTLAGNGYDVAFSPDGSLLAVVYTSAPRLTVLNTSDWSTVAGVPTLNSNGYSVEFSPDGTKLAVAFTSSPRLTVLNTSDWSVVSGTPTLTGTARDVSFSPDGSLLAVVYISAPYLTIINTSDWSVVSGTPTLNSISYGVDFSPDGTLLAASSTNSPRLTILKTSDWSVVAGTPDLPGTANSVSFNPVGNNIGVAHSVSPNLTVINGTDFFINNSKYVQGGQLITRADYPELGYVAEALPNSSNLGVFKVPQYRTTTATLYLIKKARTSNNIALSTGSTSRRLVLLNESGDVVFNTSGLSQTYDLAFNADDSVIIGVTSSSGSKFYVISGVDGSLINTGIPTPSGGLYTVTYSPDFSTFIMAGAYTGVDPNFLMYDSTSYTQVNTITPDIQTAIYDVRYSPDGTKLFIASAAYLGSNLRVYNASTGVLETSLNLGIGAAHNISFSVDGTMVAIATLSVVVVLQMSDYNTVMSVNISGLNCYIVQFIDNNLVAAMFTNALPNGKRMAIYNINGDSIEYEGGGAAVSILNRPYDYDPVRGVLYTYGSSNTRTLYMINTRSLNCYPFPVQLNSAQNFQLSSDRMIASEFDQIYVYDKYGYQTDYINDRAIAVSNTVIDALSPNEQIFAVMSTSIASVNTGRLYDAKTWNIIADFDAELNTAAISWSPDSKKIAMISSSAPTALKILDVVTLTYETPTVPVTGLSGVSYSPDGKYIAFGVSSNSNIYVYTVNPWAQVRLFDTVGTIQDLQWVSDRYLIVLGSTAPRIDIYDVVLDQVITGTNLQNNFGTAVPRKVRLVPNRNQIVIAASESLTLAEIGTWNILGTQAAPGELNATTIVSLEVTKDGHYAIVLYNAASGSIVYSLTSYDPLFNAYIPALTTPLSGYTSVIKAKA